MALLDGPCLVLFKNGIDDAQPRPQLGPPYRQLPLVTRRNRVRQHLLNRLARDTKLPRHRSTALSFDQNRSPHASPFSTSWRAAAAIASTRGLFFGSWSGGHGKARQTEPRSTTALVGLSIFLTLPRLACL